MPERWVWTNRLIGRASDKVCLVYPKDASDARLGAMKIYRPQNPSQVKMIKREVAMLQELQSKPPMISIHFYASVLRCLGVPGVVAMYENNISGQTPTTDQPLWIIMPLVSNVNLEEFITQYPRRLTFEHGLILTRQLFEIVQRCHQKGVYHRNLHPTTILVQYSFDQASAKDVHLVLINFSSASINDRRRTSPLAQQMMRQDFSADMTGIGRILFWLLTDHWWESLQSMKSSYRNLRYRSAIFSKLSMAKNDVTMQTEVMKLFDHAFDSADHQWSIDDFRKQLDVITNRLIEIETKQLDTLFPSNSVTVVSPLSDPYARAVSLIAQLKQGFAEKYAACVKWSTEGNQWTGRSVEEGVKNVAQLTYHYQHRSYQLTIVCSVKMEMDCLVVSAGVGARLGGQPVEMTRIFRMTLQTPDADVSKDFEDELKHLIQQHLSNDLIVTKKQNGHL